MISNFNQAPEELKKDKQFVLKAVKNDIRCFEFIDEELKKDQEFVLSIVKICYSVLTDVSIKLKSDRAFALQAVILNDQSLIYLDKKFKSDKEFILEAIQGNYKALWSASYDLINDIDIVLAAVSKNNKAIQCVGYEILRNDDCALKIMIEILKGLLPENSQIFDFSESTKVLKEPEKSRNLLNHFRAALNLERPISFFGWLSERFSPEYYPIIKELVEKGVPITKEALLNSVRVYNYPVLELFLNSNDIKGLVKENSESLLEQIVYTNDFKAAELLFEKGLDLSSALSLLMSNMENCQYEIVEWLLEKGVKTSDQKIYDVVLAEAIKTNNLRIIQTIVEKLGDETIKKVSFPDLLKVEDSNAEQLLKGYILCSPLQDVVNLAKKLKLEKHLSKLLPYAPLFVRFPKFKFRESVDSKWRDMCKYISESWKYAAQNYDFIQSIQKEIRDLSLQDLLKKITEERYKNMSSKNESYLKEGVKTHTPFLWDSYKGSDYNKYLPQIRSRYAPSLQYLCHLIYKKEIEFKFSNNTYTIRYKGSEEKINVEMTTLSFDAISGDFVIGQWSHTPPDSVEALKPHLEDLHKEIIDFDLKPGLETKLTEKIANCYWLIATMCQKARGTPHNAMMWLNIVYTYHGLPFPIPKMNFYYLDNMALMLPVEEFVKRFNTFLEPVFLNNCEKRDLN